jgi:hypothetical protein
MPCKGIIIIADYFQNKIATFVIITVNQNTIVLITYVGIKNLNKVVTFVLMISSKVLIYSLLFAVKEL